MLNILFMGTPDFAEESLKSIDKSGFNILGVVTNPDKPKGRGMKMVSSPVKEYALEKNIPVYQPIKVRNNPEFIEEVRKMNPDVICVVAYGKILPEELLKIPKLGCINVHGSLLPKYRGAAPIQWAVINGDKKEVDIGGNETTGELWDRLAKIGGELLVETLNKIEDGTAPREKQGENFTMAPMLNKEMSKIDWENQSAIQIKNLVRGLNPIMGAYCYLNDKKIKFWKVDVVNKFESEIKDINKLENGTVLIADPKEGLFIKTKEGILEVLEIQGENAKRMPIGDFLRGNKCPKEIVLK